MSKVVKYDYKTTYMFPTGKLASPEVVASEYPATEAFDHVFYLDDSKTILTSMEPIGAACARYHIDTDLPEDEQLAAIQKAVDTRAAEAEVQNPEPSAEERIAAALEYQNLLSM